MANFICDSKYVCNFVLEKIISYLPKKDKINIKFTCKYMKNKIKIYELSEANHLTGLVYPELKFLNIGKPKPKLKKIIMPESKALYFEYSSAIKYYNYDFQNVEKLYIKRFDEYYDIDKFYNLKELFITKFELNDDYYMEYFDGKKYGRCFSKLKILSIPSFYSGPDFKYLKNLKILKTENIILNNSKEIIHTFIISEDVDMDNCNITNLCLLGNSGRSLLDIRESQIFNLILVNFDNFEDLILKGSLNIISNILVIDCSKEFIKYVEVKFRKKCIISNKNILPKKNIFDIQWDSKF